MTVLWRERMIRAAEKDDLPQLLKLYETARRFMAQHGNESQWGATEPPLKVLEDDIQKKQLYVCTKEDRIYGAFAWILGEDATYAVIEDGAWKSDTVYGTIHRIASDGTRHGVFLECLEFCKKECGHLRIDTHADNYVMQRCIEKSGFARCGTIYVRNHSPRIAYEYVT